MSIWRCFYFHVVGLLSFKDLNLQIKYDSDNSDILNEFYIPVLSNSSMYFRISGFFSSTSLAISARGIGEFIKNNGKMKLICSAILSEDDYKKMKEVYETPEDLLEEKFLVDLNNLSNIFIKSNLAALGFMLANGNLEIKIAIPNDCSGMLHSKIGIMVDSFGDMISFSGSDNETANGWIHNIEEFKVFKSWVDGQKEYFFEDLDNFYKYWNNDASKMNIVDLPEAINDELIKLAPNDSSDVCVYEDFESEVAETVNSSSVKNEITLRDYQTEAINNWLLAEKKGIFEMATGTGKTFTGLGCMDKVKKEYILKGKPLLIVIAAPTSHLVDQWEKDVSKFNVDYIIKAYSSNSTWKTKISDLLLDLRIGEFNNLVILTTHSTLSKDYFHDYLSQINVDRLLIVDEVHGIGSKNQRLALNDALYKYRLGLSATPERWNDEEGNYEIKSFFGDVVYKFTLSDALIRINPETGKTFLTPYEYYPIFVELTDEEFAEYRYYSGLIAQLYIKLKKSRGNNQAVFDKIEEYLYIRQRILNVAENKYGALKDLIDDLNCKTDPLNDLIIYCHNTNQLEKVNSILNSKSILRHKFTGEESISERLSLLDKFSSGSIQSLVAMKCLDEGVDVPSAKTAIIMASTSNPREYIQRRGRILRRNDNKDLAIIYDMVISFSKKQIMSLDNQEKELEIKIMEKESKRYREFARDAENYDHCFKLLDEYFEGVF